MDILKHIKVVPDFPKEGINFYDIQSLMTDPPVWRRIIEAMTEKTETYSPNIIVGLESRGFLVGLPVAQALDIPFAMIRKKGKLPGNVTRQSYALEYGEDCIEIQTDILNVGQRVAILDDLLATGGTMAAAGELIKKRDAETVCGICMIELEELNGASKLDFPFEALTKAPA